MEKLRKFKVGPEDWKAINAYGWPGNVRQLITVLKRAALTDISIAESIAEEKPIRTNGAQPTAVSPGCPFLPLPRSQGEVKPIEQIDVLYMAHVLTLYSSYKQASEALGISENTLRKYVPRSDKAR
jgi:transcriptional regulator with PAS, ATPase and Fis domain